MWAPEASAPSQVLQETILTCSVFSEKNNDLFQTKCSKVHSLSLLNIIKNKRKPASKANCEHVRKNREFSHRCSSRYNTKLISLHSGLVAHTWEPTAHKGFLQLAIWDSGAWANGHVPGNSLSIHLSLNLKLPHILSCARVQVTLAVKSRPMVLEPGSPVRQQHGGCGGEGFFRVLSKNNKSLWCCPTLHPA